MTKNLKRNAIVGIASGKGGVGKTFLTVNLATALSAAGRRVLVFDADLGLANVDLQIGLQVKTRMTDFLFGRLSFAQLVTRSDVTGCDVIGGRPGTGFLSNTTDHERWKIKQGLQEVAQNYDYLLIDFPAGIDNNVTDFLDVCNKLFVVLRSEPTALMDAYALVKLAPDDLRHEIWIVANNVTNHDDGVELSRGFSAVAARFLGFSPNYLGAVRADVEVSNAIHRQLPVITAAPHSQAALDIQAVARKLM